MVNCPISKAEISPLIPDLKIIYLGGYARLYIYHVYRYERIESPINNGLVC